MSHQHRILQTAFSDQAFVLDCNNDDAYNLAQFLFTDLPGNLDCDQPKQYDIISSGPLPMLSLWEGDKRLYFGNSRYEAAYILMNEVVFHCINSNSRQHAIHAGAVTKGEQCFILPGKSGHGKSTLTAWLISNGYHYLTDELILLSPAGQVLPLTRPISLKINAAHSTWLAPAINTGGCIAGELGSMIPHRLLNPDFQEQRPSLTHIIYPEFKEGTAAVFTEISPALSCLHLLQSHVNARNLKEHGIPEITALVKRCKSYKLTYGSLADLPAIFSTATGLF